MENAKDKAKKIITMIYPDMASSSNIDDYLELAISETNRCFFGNLFPRAVAYKACHFFMLFDKHSDSAGVMGMGSAPISSISEGGLSIGFNASSNLDNSYSTTKYGKMYLTLLKLRPRMGVNISPFCGNIDC